MEKPLFSSKIAYINKTFIRFELLNINIIFNARASNITFLIEIFHDKQAEIILRFFKYFNFCALHFTMLLKFNYILYYKLRNYM